MLNINGRIEVRVSRTMPDSFISSMINMMEAAEIGRAHYRRLADRAASLYTPVVHALAAGSFIAWMLATGSWHQALTIAVSVLVITCPCALGLAVPMVHVMAARRLFELRIALKDGSALERAAEADTVVFDKTGTLTLGEPVLRTESESERGVIDQAAMLARASHHPFSRALAKAAGPGPIAANVHETPGKGVSGIIDGRRARLGSAAFAGVPPGSGTELWFTLEGAEPAVFHFDDAIRPDASETVASLKSMGMDVELLSGDGEQRVSRAANAAGVARWKSGVTPLDKARHISTLEAAGKRVLMVGDGLNDAGALAGAHASIAPGGAVDVSRLASDCVFSGDSLRAITHIVATARTARARMRENFAFAALYNVVVIPVALAGWVTPLIAAIAMSASPP